MVESGADAALQLGASSLSALVLVFLAEFGDKSQLVCMTLAARHRGQAVFWGAVCAFALLNLLAVVFGATVAAWVPEQWLAIGVAVLFGLFGVQALRNGDADEEEAVEEKSGRGVFVSAFLMIFVAEFGDKTQLAVAGLGAAEYPPGVWLGATLALILTTLLGVVAGRALLKRMPVHVLHKLGGVFFLVLAATALYRAFA